MWLSGSIDSHNDAVDFGARPLFCCPRTKQARTISGAGIGVFDLENFCMRSPTQRSRDDAIRFSVTGVRGVASIDEPSHLPDGDRGLLC